MHKRKLLREFLNWFDSVQLTQTSALYRFQTCTEGSNPSRSATQSGVQRNSPRSTPKYPNNARISRLFPGKSDWGERTARHRMRFSPVTIVDVSDPRIRIIGPSQIAVGLVNE